RIHLYAYKSGGDWRSGTHHNGILESRPIVSPATVGLKTCRGVKGRANKVTPEIRAVLGLWLDKYCTFTLRTLKAMVFEDFGATLPETTISRHLVDVLYTVKY
ncbi:hypothetical protein L914_08263, partial [Phytophthora nicotianae]